MIDKFVESLRKKNRILWGIGVLFIFSGAIFEYANNVYSLINSTASINLKILMLVSLIVLLLIANSLSNNYNGRIDYKIRRLSRFVALLLLFGILFYINELFDFVGSLNIQINSIYIGIIVLMGLLFVVHKNVQDKQQFTKYRILVCELSEGASKEIPADRHITQTILESLRNELDPNKVEIIEINEVVLDEENAVLYGRNSKSVAVLYGWYTKLSDRILLNINFKLIEKNATHYTTNSPKRAVGIEKLNNGTLQIFLAKDMILLSNFLISFYELSKNKYQESIELLNFILETVSINNEVATYSIPVWIIHFYLGECYYHLSDYKNAKVSFDNAQIHNPDFPKTLHNLGAILFLDEKYKEAINYFDQAIELDQQTPIYIRNKAFTKIALNNFIDAELDINRFLELLPDDIDGLRIKSICKHGNGDVDGAIQIYKKILRKMPLNYFDWYALANLYIINNNKIYGLVIMGLLGFVPRNTSISLGKIGKFFYTESKYKKALFFLTFISRNQPDVELLHLRARTFKQLSDNSGRTKKNRAQKKYTNNAISDLEKIIQLGGSNRALDFDIGNLYIDLEEFEKSLSFFTHAIDSTPIISKAYINRGFAYLKLTNYKLAVEDFEIAIENSNDIEEKANGLYLKAIAELNQGKIPDSEESIILAIELSPTNPVYLRFFGMIK